MLTRSPSPSYICCIHSECMLVFSEVKLCRRNCAVGTGNSPVRFYDVTSWSYVNLDDLNLGREVQPLARKAHQKSLGAWICTDDTRGSRQGR